MDTSYGASPAVRVAVLAAIAILATTPWLTAEPEYSEWSQAANLGPLVNSSGADIGPALSKDGQSLYFVSTRPGLGGSDLFVSRWDRESEQWGAALNLGAVVNSAAAEMSPALSRDGHWLFFTRGGPGARDIWISYREDVHDDLAWQTPVSAGPGVNSAGDDQDPSFFANDDEGVPQLFFARGEDIYVSSLQPDGTFGGATPVSDLNTASNDRGISVRFDGLEAFFFSNRAPSLGALVNSIGADGEPEISPDRDALYFNSNRAGGSGAFDLYVTRRQKKNEERGKP
jgi:Tol biopolymer transport system component